MQKALEQMNVKLTEVVSDITGVTGMTIEGAHCSILPLGTSTVVEFWVDARKRLESTRSADWSIR
jgi:hypothetical protein